MGKVFEDVVTLGQGHSIILGNLPPDLSDLTFTEKLYEATSREHLSSFGLYGHGIDWAKFGQTVTAPDNGEFIEPIYRLLSEVIVHRQWNPVDFSINGVLKKSMGLLVGQSVYTDHWSSVSNVVGSVKNTVWQESYVDTFKGKKIVVPAGINGTLKVDALSNPKLARGILMDPPSVHSNSVTVRFKWDKSHPDLEDNEFWEKLGRLDKKGEQIRRVAVDIISYSETSLVSNGADPFAKQLDKDGKIILPGTANRNYSSFSEQNYNNGKYYFFDLKGLVNEETLHNTAIIINESQNPKSNENYKPDNNENNMDELNKFLESIFGDNLLSLKEGETANQDLALAAIKSAIANEKTAKADLVLLKEKHTALEAEVATLKTFKSDNESFIEAGKTSLENLRADVKADYVKLSGGEDKADAAILAVFENADLKTLSGFKKSYSTQLEEKFPLSCDKCGSKEVSRSSSLSDEEEQENSEAKGFTIQEIREKKYRESITNSKPKDK